MQSFLLFFVSGHTTLKELHVFHIWGWRYSLVMTTTDSIWGLAFHPKHECYVYVQGFAHIQHTHAHMHTSTHHSIHTCVHVCSRHSVSQTLLSLTQWCKMCDVALSFPLRDVNKDKSGPSAFPLLEKEVQGPAPHQVKSLCNFTSDALVLLQIVIWI